MQLAPILPKHCIITDVGSVKGDITQAVAELGLTSQFIGGHPMAGSEAIGYDHSNAHLLENAYYILTVTDDFPHEQLADFSTFIRSLGALTLIMSPSKHDFATACISHLPHVIAASLVNFVQENDFSDETMKTIAAGGFRDITRIASSSPVMWQHICATNKEEILKAASLYEKNLHDFITSISHEKDYRDNLPVKKQGILPSSYEFYLDVADEAGAIATIATTLAANGISIKNIGIVHNREFEKGVLRIEVYDQNAMDAAENVLQKHYTIHE